MPCAILEQSPSPSPSASTVDEESKEVTTNESKSELKPDAKDEATDTDKLLSSLKLSRPSAAAADGSNALAPFTPEEDAQIITRVKNSDTQPFSAWSSLAVLKMPGRTGKQIRERWENVLNKSVNSDQNIVTGSDEKNNCHAEVVSTEESKSKRRSLDINSSNNGNPSKYRLSRGIYSEGEDATIIEAVETSCEKPFTSWSLLALRLPGRTGKQLRDRWINNLNPEIDHSPFGRSDDLLLTEAYAKVGSKWKDISASFFNGKRSENQVKNRFHLSVYKKLAQQGFPAHEYFRETKEGVLWKKRKQAQDALAKEEELSKKKKKRSDQLGTDAVAALLNTQQLPFMPGNTQIMNHQMMNPQLFNVNPQMAYWNQMQGMIPPFAQPNHAANKIASQTMMMLGAGMNSNLIAPIPPNVRSLQLILTLPPPKEKLGILLSDRRGLSLPELKSVATNSPIQNQIPQEFQSGCCVFSLKSEMIGHVQPKSAQECATLIVKSQEGLAKPPKLEIALLQLKDAQSMHLISEPNTVPKRKVGRKAKHEVQEHNRILQSALLDFFSDPRKPHYAYFIQEYQYKKYIRSSMVRVINSHERLVELLDMRDVAARRKEAYDIIEKMVPYSPAEQTKASKDQKAALQGYFSGPSSTSLSSFYHDKEITPKMRAAMNTLIDTSPLSKIMGQQHLPEQRKEAFSIIDKLFSDRSVQAETEKAELDQELKKALMDHFSDSSCSSLLGYCKRKRLDIRMHGIVGRFIDKDTKLSQLLLQRGVAERREEAFDRIKELLPMIPAPNSHAHGNEESSTDSKKEDEQEDEQEDVNSNSPTRCAEPKSKREAWAAFFLPANIKIVASKLDFEARPRITRDGTKEILVHERKSADELLMLSIFDLSNRVLRGRALQPKEKDAVMGHCASILFYDYGFKKVRGATQLDKTWETRLEHAYISGADTSPLQGNYNGSTSYTDEIEKHHPGLIAQLYEHTEERIGKTASFKDKAAFMNEMSAEDAENEPSLPILKINKGNLFRWAQSVGKVSSEKSKPKAHPELTLEHIEQHHPGLVEGLYNFAVEALGSDASAHMLATCMNERSKEDVEQDPTVPLVLMSKITLPCWLKKRASD